MEIKLNGWQAGAIAGGIVTEAVVAFVALHKWKKEWERADDAEFGKFLRGCELNLKNYQIKKLENEIAELKK